MIHIERPKVNIEEKENGAFATFVVEPLEKGFGITLGNAVRRTLLGSMPGAGVVGVKIDGVQHEFSSVTGVKEDVTDIVLNLKGNKINVKTEKLSQDVIDIIMSNIDTTGKVDTSKAGKYRN